MPDHSDVSVDVEGCSAQCEVLKERFGRHRELIGWVVGVGMLLLLVLLPTSFAYVEYYEYGLIQRKSTGRVRTDRVYDAGRYSLGPDRKFRTYQADSHRVDFDELSVFSAGATNNSIGLEFRVDITFTYLIIREEVGLLHEELGRGYAAVVESRARAAIKNTAASFAFNDYFQERDALETRLFEAIGAKLSEAPSLHVTLDQLILGRVQIPDSVAQKQLDVKVQLERNDEQTNLKKAQLERDQTQVLVNDINLRAQANLRIARAEAELTVERGKAEARDIVSTQLADGLAKAFNATGLHSVKHKASYDYLRTLAARTAGGAGGVTDSLSVSFLHPKEITPTSDADATE